MKVVRTLYFFFIALILLLCLLFALLQTRWAKESLANHFKTFAAQKGIEIDVGKVEGLFPFSLQIDRLSFTLQQTQVACEQIRVRLSPFSLLKGKLALSYVDVKEAHVSLARGTAPALFVPQGLVVDRLKVHRLVCESESYTLEVKADLEKPLNRFLFDARLSLYEAPHEALQIGAVGSRTRGSVSVQVKAHLSTLALLAPFYPLPHVEEVQGTCTLHGSWASFDAFIHKRHMHSPLTLTCQGELRPTEISPLFNRLWHVDLDSAIDAVHTYSVNRLQLRSDLLTMQGQGVIDEAIEKSRFDARLVFPDLKQLSDRVHGTLEAQLQLAHAHINLALQSQSIALGAFAPQKIDARIEAHPSAQGWEGEMTSALPISGHFAFNFVPFSTLTLSDFSLKSGPFFTSGALQLDLAHRQLAGDLYAHVQETGSAAFHFAHEEGRQTLDAFFLGVELSASFKADEEVPGEYPFSLDIQKPDLQCAMQGRLSVDEKLIALEAIHLAGTYLAIPFSLNTPCVLEKGRESASLSPLDMQIGQGTLTASCDLSSVRSTGAFSLTQFPLEWLGPHLSGSLTANAFFDVTPDNLQGALTAALEEAHVKASLQVHADHNIVQTHLLMSSQNQGAELTATVPLTYQLYPFKLSIHPTESLSAQCVAEARVQDLLDWIPFGTHQFTGFLNTRLFLSGSALAPILQGELSWEEGSYDNYLTGTALKNVHAELRAEKDQIHLITFHADDGKKGKMSAEGTLNLAPDFPFYLTAELDAFRALHFNPLDCTLTGSLYIQGTQREATAYGNLLVDAAEYTLQNARALEIPTLPVTLLHIPAATSEAVITNKIYPLHLNLDLTAEKRVMVLGRGLKSEWKGALHLTGTNTTVRLDGDLDLLNGEYDLFGKTFKLTEGQILFSDKSGAVARIHLTGALSLPEATITAHLRGPLASPTLTLQSNPQMSTSAILARILFNKDISDISQPEALQLATALISLSGGAGPSILETIRKNLGIDRLTIASQTNNPDEIAVQIGKYLTKGVMVTLSQSATSSQIIIEVEFKHGFVFRAETQEVQEGKFSLKWTHSY